jgi:hypothetical protein
MGSVSIEDTMGTVVVVSLAASAAEVVRNAATRLAFGSGEPECRNPTTGIAGCCPRAVSGHAAAPPRSVMNSRRLISCIRMPITAA